MASPLTILLDGQKHSAIAHNQEKQLTLAENTALQVQFYWLKSQPIILSAADGKHFVITMNPLVLQIYLLFFGLSLLMSLLSQNLLLVLSVVLVYLLCLRSFLKKVYVIKEEFHG